MNGKFKVMEMIQDIFLSQAAVPFLPLVADCPDCKAGWNVLNDSGSTFIIYIARSILWLSLNIISPM